jgi:hypothetical protein
VAKIQAPVAGCHTGFKPFTATFANYTTLSGFRHNGGWVDDVNRDGWDDIHLPYLQYILSISGVDGTQLGLAHFDVAAQTEPSSPPYFHSGRFYGSFAAFNSPSAATRKLLISAGNPVGRFADIGCNASRYVTVLDWANGFGLAWSKYLSFVKTIFFENPWSITHYSRWGEGIDKCVHRASDSLFWGGNSPVVLYSIFTADPPADDCQSSVLCEQEHAEYNECPGQYNCCFYECADANWLPDRGSWKVQALNADNGAVGAMKDGYLWGRVQRFWPNEPYALLLETFGGDGKVRFDQVGHTNRSFSFTKVLSSTAWRATPFGSVSGVGGAPKIDTGVPVGAYPNYGAPLVALGTSWESVPELVTNDVDGDGLNDVQLTDGQWVGYSPAGGGTVVVKP